MTLFAMAASGFTIILTKSKAMRWFRRLFEPERSIEFFGDEPEEVYHTTRMKAFFKAMLECPMCTGFWVGPVVWLLMQNQYTIILCYAFAASVSWAAWRLIGEK